MTFVKSLFAILSDCCRDWSFRNNYEYVDIHISAVEDLSDKEKEAIKGLIKSFADVDADYFNDLLERNAQYEFWVGTVNICLQIALR